MTKERNDLIQRVASAFADQLTSEYFKSERPRDVIQSSLQDPSCLNRLFDDVKLSPELMQELYQAVLASKNPVQEFLEPLVMTIGAQILNPLKTGLNETILSYFPENNQMAALCESQEQYRDIIIRAIACGCNAMVAGKFDEVIKAGVESTINPEEFSSRISLPCDEYAKTVSAARLYPTVLGSIYRAFLFVVKFFSGGNDSIENRVLKLHSSMEAGIRKLNTYIPTLTEQERPKYEQLRDNLTVFCDNLFNLKSQIADKKGFKIPYESAVTLDFNSQCKAFVESVRNELTAIEQQEQLKLQQMSPVQQWFHKLFNRNMEMDTMKWLTGSDPVLLRNYREVQPSIVELSTFNKKPSDETNPDTADGNNRLEI